MLTIRPYAGVPHKDRFIATLLGEHTDRVPHFEILIEDQHVANLLGRPAGNTLGVGGDPAKGVAAAEGTRPMYLRDYIDLCRIIGQDMIALEATWTPIMHVRPDGTVGPIADRSIKTWVDLKRIVWSGEADLEEKVRYVRKYVMVAQGTSIGSTRWLGSRVPPASLATPSRSCPIKPTGLPRRRSPGEERKHGSSNQAA
jgi:hypothetical protein